MEFSGVGQEMLISLKLFRDCNWREVWFQRRPHEMSSSPWVTASKQAMQNIITVTIEFSLDNTEKKFEELFGNQIPSNSKHLIGQNIIIILVKFTNPKG